jgi:leader peptidase (prepilin peptidase)/N-methyltransferase
VTPEALVPAILTGLAAGPLARTAAWRYTGEPAARTACPACGRRDPVQAPGPYTGRCPSCRTRSGPAPLVPEVLTAAGFALAALIGGPLLQTAATCILALFTVALALIDASVHRLPDTLTLPAFAVTALLLAGAALGRGQPGIIPRLLAAALALAAVYVLFALLGGMGLGDAKLALSLGAILGYLSWPALLQGTIAAFILGALYGAVRLLHGASTRDDMPFGPFMIAGAFLTLALHAA